jgi:hypothetical protein
MDIQNMRYLDSSKEDDDSTFSNIIIILVVVGALWLIFGPTKERFSDNQSGMQIPLMPTSDSVVSPTGMMGVRSNANLMAELTNASDQYDANASVLTPVQKQIEDNIPADMTPDVRSLKAMDAISQADSKGMSCNMLGINPKKLSKYKKKYYSMYKHQVECPKNCGLGPVGTRDCYFDRLGMKKCGMDGDDKACGGIFTTEYNNPDVFALGYLALDNNNKRPCVTCTLRPSGNNLNRADIAENVTVFDNTPLKEGFVNLGSSDSNAYDSLPAETKAADEKRMFQKNVSDANVSNYVDFENNVYLNSIGETPVDKMAEIRSGSCASGTCGLQSYGKSIANVYDKLLDTPAYTNRASCNPDSITGFLEDASYASGYANYNWSN